MSVQPSIILFLLYDHPLFKSAFFWLAAPLKLQLGGASVSEMTKSRISIFWPHTDLRVGKKKKRKAKLSATTQLFSSLSPSLQVKFLLIGCPSKTAGGWRFCASMTLFGKSSLFGLIKKRGLKKLSEAVWSTGFKLTGVTCTYVDFNIWNLGHIYYEHCVLLFSFYPSFLHWKRKSWKDWEPLVWTQKSWAYLNQEPSDFKEWIQNIWY